MLVLWNCMTHLPYFCFYWMHFLTTWNFFIFNQLATCLFLLFAFPLLAHSYPCSHGGCSSIRPPCCHLLLLFTYLLSGTTLPRHKIRINPCMSQDCNIIDFKMLHTLSMRRVATLKDVVNIQARCSNAAWDFWWMLEEALIKSNERAGHWRAVIPTAQGAYNHCKNDFLLHIFMCRI